MAGPPQFFGSFLKRQYQLHPNTLATKDCQRVKDAAQKGQFKRICSTLLF
jgi:hypothetical protein